jgi:hypothetical protein
MGQPTITKCGLLMHATLAVTTAGKPLGLTAVKFWTRKKFKGTNALAGRVKDGGKHSVNATRIELGRLVEQPNDDPLAMTRRERSDAQIDQPIGDLDARPSVLRQPLLGVCGGYELARPASKITLLEIIEAVDGLLECGFKGDLRLTQKANAAIRGASAAIDADARKRLSAITIAYLRAVKAA